MSFYKHYHCNVTLQNEKGPMRGLLLFQSGNNLLHNGSEAFYNSGQPYSIIDAGFGSAML
jgi:hypothetical protein